MSKTGHTTGEAAAKSIESEAATGPLATAYESKTVEARTYQLWLDEKAFRADPAAPGEAYCIVMPPPNVTGALHLGHALNATLQDILIRVHRMRGFNVLWVPGIDHAGIATQAVVERQLKEKENKTRHDVGREALVERIWAWKEQYGERILDQLKRVGCSCDWSRARFTLDEMCARAVRETFFKLFKDGLIYRGKRLVNWDIALQTSISDDEIYHETVKTSLWHIRYPIADASAGPTYMTVATTRPETMLGDTAVAVHSQDARWNWAIGKFVELPLTGRKIPIIADDILVDPKFGSGVVKVTPAHDPNDYAVYQRKLNKPDAIEILNILNADGTLGESAGAYAGMKRDAARKRVVADLEKLGLLEKEEPHEAPVGHSDRSKTPVEPYLSDQWFVEMAPLAERALKAVRERRVQFHPDRYAQSYLAWLGEKRDWPISRQLWWGHRIPVWRHDSAPQDLRDFVRAEPDRVHLVETDAGAFICTADEQIAKQLERYGAVQDPDVLDTWFSSSLWPHSTLGWPGETAELAKWYPTSVLSTAREIITLWVARMVMTGLYNLKEIPFTDVYIHPTILDGKGERMSKSKGNGVDPVDIIDTHGADGLRFVLAQMATETQDVRLPVKKLPDGRNTSDKFDLGRNFCNKLWNAARFVLTNLESIEAIEPSEKDLSLADRWIISRFNQTLAETNAALAAYRFDQYTKLCYDFFWRDFCDWYVEAAKPDLKDATRAGVAAAVLAALLDGALRLLHPVVPFITETIWPRLNAVRPRRGIAGCIECPQSKLIISAGWPGVGKAFGTAETAFARVQDLIVALRNVRNEYKAPARKPIAVSLSGEPSKLEAMIANRGTIELLATCELKEIREHLAPPGGAVRILAADCEIFVQDLVDPEAERQRLNKQRDDLAKTIAALRGRLNNDSYIARAPAQLVQQTRDQLAAAETELQKLMGEH